ncbi:hypothetical protein [Streptomyces sp. CB02261]|uniref:hypothetical protein n=1 Tax=Streptomyces sp. CB02261 TaxID=1703940 RepID=UPI0009393E65|nr:hypothetical protein [Streptomyces sp. CB02261]OKJ52551.1 hypothetical protein AMK29_30465 [Streptomyces sp. CB02261]
MAIPTPMEFRTAHGDPAGWCGAEIDEYLDDCLATLPTPTPATVHLLTGGGTRSGENPPPALPANAA